MQRSGRLPSYGARGCARAVSSSHYLLRDVVTSAWGLVLGTLICSLFVTCYFELPANARIYLRAERGPPEWQPSAGATGLRNDLAELHSRLQNERLPALKQVDSLSNTGGSVVEMSQQHMDSKNLDSVEEALKASGGPSRSGHNTANTARGVHSLGEEERTKIDIVIIMLEKTNMNQESGGFAVELDKAIRNVAVVTPAAVRRHRACAMRGRPSKEPQYAVCTTANTRAGNQQQYRSKVRSLVDNVRSIGYLTLLCDLWAVYDLEKELDKLSKRTSNATKNPSPVYEDLLHVCGCSKPSCRAFLVKPLLHKVLPKQLEKVLVLDLDLFIVDAISGLWAFFESFSESQVMGLVEELQPTYAPRHLKDNSNASAADLLGHCAATEQPGFQGELNNSRGLLVPSKSASSRCAIRVQRRGAAAEPQENARLKGIQ
eukprot:scaffold1554_cov401-Prasinococcus_capsulatus_cf.AAC.6